MKTRVICAGTFDHLHDGHLSFLRQAKSLGDELIVIVARDSTVQRIKGFRPSNDEERRRRDVAETGIPDAVVLGNLESDILQILEELKPEIVAVGYDQRVSEEEVSRRFPSSRVVRLAPFHPEKYKSSFFRDKEKRL
jgi:FAD synthetase